MVGKRMRGTCERWAASGLLIGLFAVAAPSTPATAATFTVSTFTELQDAVNSPSPVAVVLDADITSNGTGLTLPAGSQVTLDLHGHVLTITAGTDQAGIRTTRAGLTVEADGGGAIHATGGGFGSSGIGGARQQDGGTITINGGTIDATGSASGAGIGGGYDRSGGTITINGGTINARGGAYGAGIGGGFAHSGGTITINGGTVSATGGRFGAGIGGGGYEGSGGAPGGSAGTITIVSGTVNATGGTDATGIGGGSSDVGSAGGQISIGPDAAVVATSSGAFAAIGANGSTPTGSVTNAGTLTLHGDQAVRPDGTFVNEATGVILLHNRLDGTGTVTNHGTIVLAPGAEVDYTEATLTDHAYVIGYDLNGVAGTPPAVQQVWALSYTAAQVTLPTPPSGYAWFSAPAGGTPVDATTDLPGRYGPLTAGPPDSRTTGWHNVTLHLAKPTVTFEPNNGDPAFTQVVDYDTPATEPADPTRPGSTFEGWYHAGDLWDFATSVTSDLTLGARWAPAPPSLTCHGEDATIIGTAGDDVLVGTPGRDVIVARGGKDLVSGRGGADIICAAGGPDTIAGGEGDDHQYGGRGHDRLFGRGGSDTLVGRAGDDILRGGPGDDTLRGGPGRDDVVQ